MASEQPLEFHPDALAELERANAWYEAQCPGLGESFFQEITTAISRIREAPNTWREYRQGTRRFLVHRFPLLPTRNQSSRHGRDASETKTRLLAGTITISAQLSA